jgi:hypothetical protein
LKGEQFWIECFQINKSIDFPRATGVRWQPLDATNCNRLQQKASFSQDTILGTHFTILS